MRALPLSFALLLLAGCITPRRDAATPAPERARAEAAKARYWQIQAAQQGPAANPKHP